MRALRLGIGFVLKFSHLAVRGLAVTTDRANREDAGQKKSKAASQADAGSHEDESDGEKRNA